LNADEFARLKHDVETRQVSVDKAFARLDDFTRRLEGERRRDSSIGSTRNEVEEKVVLLERLMEAMSRLNASYRDYVQVLEKELGL
jgi:hypothetical protein